MHTLFGVENDFNLTSSAEYHWENIAREFNFVYRKEKEALRRAFNKLFSRNMAERARLTLEECKDAKGKKILDIGGGLGHIRTELEKRGALIVGIGLFNDLLMEGGTRRKLEFEKNLALLHGDFMSHLFRENFDISVALGVFDYIGNPVPYLKKMQSVTVDKCIISFPSKFAFPVPPRMIWCRSRKFPSHLYTKREIKRILSPAFPRFRIKNICAGYHCVARAYFAV